jgi:hypothetical protein
VTLLDRDASSADALLTDLYLDAVLADRSPHGDPASPSRAGRSGPDSAAGLLDPAVRLASERLRRDLVRVHPSFRFEERLATRLAEAAVGLRMPAAVGAEGRVVPFRGPGFGPTGPRTGPADRDPDVSSDGRHELARPLLIGGALTSAALSLAGAALVAWRRSRPGSPMVRAARAVRDAREAAGVTSAAGTVPLRPHRLD